MKLHVNSNATKIPRESTPYITLFTARSRVSSACCNALCFIKLATSQVGRLRSACSLAISSCEVWLLKGASFLSLNIGFLVSGFDSFCIMPHDCLLQRVSLSFSLWTSQFKLEGKPKIAIDLIVVMLPFLNYKYELLWQFNVISCLKVYMKITVEPPIMATSLQQLFFRWTVHEFTLVSTSLQWPRPL